MVSLIKCFILLSIFQQNLLYISWDHVALLGQSYKTTGESKQLN